MPNQENHSLSDTILLSFIRMTMRSSRYTSHILFVMYIFLVETPPFIFFRWCGHTLDKISFRTQCLLSHYIFFIIEKKNLLRVNLYTPTCRVNTVLWPGCIQHKYIFRWQSKNVGYFQKLLKNTRRYGRKHLLEMFRHI